METINYQTTLRIRVKTFFNECIHNTNIDSNNCDFTEIRRYNDGTCDMKFVSDNEDIIKKIQEMYKTYDYNILPKTEEEQRLEELSNENKELGQMITELELQIIEMQMSLRGEH